MLNTKNILYEKESINLPLNSIDKLNNDVTIPLTDTQSPIWQINRDEEPVIQFVHQMLINAINNHISDIHIEPYETTCRIRFRRDGLLFEISSISTHFAIRVIARLKVMSQLNIAENRLPQDGRLQLHHPQKMTIRINTCPTLFGEKVVLRLLFSDKKHLQLEELGFSFLQHRLLLKKLLLPQGLILVSGPTGSGKTFTLYSVLQYLNQIEKNISTVEDPVEVELPNINQVNINQTIGLDFPIVLRALLRQDPDVIMIGEIRDSITAKIAIQAAQTGHLVLSTLHANHTIEVITRLKMFGIPSTHIVSSLILIISQRLIRRLCPYCKKPMKDSNKSHVSTPFESNGCNQCFQGYIGRTGIFELLGLEEKIKKQILDKKNDHHFRVEPNLLESALEKVYLGLTSYSEIARVLGNVNVSNSKR